MAKSPPVSLQKQWIDVALRESIWDVGNECLYALCRTYPEHVDQAEVTAKIWLIGRAYSAAAERGVAGEGQAEKYIANLSRRFISKKADSYLKHLPNSIADLRKHLDGVIEAHRSFESIFSNADELGRISLTSKYLHFHRPDLFPIYDSRAAKAIAQVTPDSRFTGHAVLPEHAASTYGKFAMRVAWLLGEMEEVVRSTPTLRQVDNLLLEVHRATIKGRNAKRQ